VERTFQPPGAERSRVSFTTVRNFVVIPPVDFFFDVPVGTWPFQHIQDGFLAAFSGPVSCMSFSAGGHWNYHGVLGVLLSLSDFSQTIEWL
jgi:hypothetical protein